MKSDNYFPSAYRLLKPRDYLDLSKRGATIRGSSFKVRCSTNDCCHPRLGLTVSKRVSKKASVRNYIKRQIRENFRKKKHLLPPMDIVFIANVSSSNLSGKQLSRAANYLLDEVNQNFGNKFL